MVDFDNALNRFRQIFDRSKILESPGLKNILIVLDETKDREEFIFHLIKEVKMELKIRFLDWNAGIPVAMLNQKTAKRIGIHTKDMISMM